MLNVLDFLNLKIELQFEIIFILVDKNELHFFKNYSKIIKNELCINEIEKLQLKELKNLYLNQIIIIKINFIILI